MPMTENKERKKRGKSESCSLPFFRQQFERLLDLTLLLATLWF